jgi:putative membrane protein insertion efficiency factor
VTHWYNWIPLALILAYRYTLSPFLGRFCRFTPTCSRYGEGCFRRFGFWKALVLTTWRIMRCNPFCTAGIDPVPEQDDPRPFRRCRGE